MKNIFKKAFLKLDKYLTDDFAIMLCLLTLFIVLGKALIAILSLYIG
tara:strand:+ start:545 stop:685 length:141 start_codon:yes stop_codon:yes gene_type:complete